MYNIQQSEFIQFFCDVLDYIDFILLKYLYHNFFILIMYIKTVLIKAYLQFHFT